MPPARWALTLLASLALLTPPARPAGPPPRPRDRHGDPLPPGAAARFGTLRLWHDQGALGCAFSPNGERLAVLSSRGYDQQVSIWSVADGRQLGRIAFAGRPAESVVYAPGGRELAVWGREEVSLIDVGTGRVRRRFASEGRPFWSLAYAPDGKTLASGCFVARGEKRGLVRRWEVASGKEHPRLEVAAPRVDDLVFSADGQRLIAACGGDGPGTRRDPEKGEPAVVCFWEVPSGKLLRKANPRGRLPVLSPRGDAVVLHGLSNDYELWDLTIDKRIALLPGADGPRFLPDGKTLVTTNRTAQVITLWDAATGKKRGELGGRLGKSGRLISDRVDAVSPDGKALAVRRANGAAIRLWDVPSSRERRPAGGHTAPVLSLALSADGRALVSGDEAGLVIVWAASDGRERLAYSGHNRAVTATAVSPDGRTVASGDEGSGVLTWSLATGKPLHRAPARAEPRVGGVIHFGVSPAQGDRAGTRAVAFAPDGRQVLDARVDRMGHVGGKRALAGTLTLRDSVTGASGREVSNHNEAPIALSPDGKFAAFAALREQGLSALRITRLPQGGVTCRIVPPLHERHRNDTYVEQHIAGVVFSPDGKTFAVRKWTTSLPLGGFPGRDTAETTLYETATGLELLRLPPAGPGRSASTARALAFSPDGRLLAASGEGPEGDLGDRTILLLDAATGGECGRLRGHGGAALCAVFSPDGRRLYTGSEDRTVLAWDLSRFAAPDVKALTRDQLDRLWLDLAAADARRAAAAVRALANNPSRAVPMLRARLRPVTVDLRKVIAGHIEGLASDAFATRQAAQKALENLGGRAESALIEALKGELELDTRRLIQRLLARLENVSLSPDALRAVRATAVLERAATPDARRVLAALAEGAPGARLTEEAAASLRRLSPPRLK